MVTPGNYKDKIQRMWATQDFASSLGNKIAIIAELIPNSAAKGCDSYFNERVTKKKAWGNKK